MSKQPILQRQDSNHLVAQRGLAAPQAIEILDQEVDDVVLVAPGLAGGVRRDRARSPAPTAAKPPAAAPRPSSRCRRRRCAPRSSAAMSAGSSTTRPRATLTRKADGFIARNARASISRSVSGVSGQVSATTSASGSRCEQAVLRHHLVGGAAAGRDVALHRDHPHAERLREAGKPRADAAEADDQQRLAAELVLAPAQDRRSCRASGASPDCRGRCGAGASARGSAPSRARTPRRRSLPARSPPGCRPPAARRGRTDRCRR